jgi:hypothetical protein
VTNYNWNNSPGVAVGGGVYVVPGSTGAVLSQEQIYALLRTAGFSDSAAQRMLAIAGRESAGTYRSNILSDPSEAATDYSVGLFQNNYISTPIGQGRQAGWPDATGLASNPLAQAQAAFSLSSGGTNFSPWSTNAGLSAASLADAAQVAANTPESAWSSLVSQAQTVAGAGTPALGSSTQQDLGAGSQLVSAASGGGASSSSSSTSSSSSGGSQFTLVPGVSGPGFSWPGIKISTGFLWSAGFFILAGLLIIAGLVFAFRQQIESTAESAARGMATAA